MHPLKLAVTLLLESQLVDVLDKVQELRLAAPPLIFEKVFHLESFRSSLLSLSHRHVRTRILSLFHHRQQDVGFEGMLQSLERGYF